MVSDSWIHCPDTAITEQFQVHKISQFCYNHGVHNITSLQVGDCFASRGQHQQGIGSPHTQHPTANLIACTGGLGNILVTLPGQHTAVVLGPWIQSHITRQLQQTSSDCFTTQLSYYCAPEEATELPQYACSWCHLVAGDYTHSCINCNRAIVFLSQLAVVPNTMPSMQLTLGFITDQPPDSIKGA